MWQGGLRHKSWGCSHTCKLGGLNPDQIHPYTISNKLEIWLKVDIRRRQTRFG